MVGVGPEDGREEGAGAKRGSDAVHPTPSSLASVGAEGAQVQPDDLRIVEQLASGALVSVAALVDRGYVLDQGRDAYEGSGRELLNDPKVIGLYLGTLADG